MIYCHKIVETGRLELDMVQNCKGVLLKCSETISMIYKWKLRIAQQCRMVKMRNAQCKMRNNAQSDPELKILPSCTSSAIWQSGTSKLAPAGFPSSPLFASLWSAAQQFAIFIWNLSKALLFGKEADAVSSAKSQLTFEIS